MKLRFPLLALLTVVAMPLQAFGPGPFRGGSPLPSGTDGVYQAVATAPNVSGLFSWAISGGTQTTDSSGELELGLNNSWIFFVEGEVFRGSTFANVSEGKVFGILDSDPDLIAPTGTGNFQGKINLKSPIAAFNGSGSIQDLVNPARSFQFRGTRISTEASSAAPAP
jgi:hypothetical protein